MRLRIFAEHKSAPAFDRGAVALLVRQILEEEGKKSRSVNIVFVDDDYLSGVNRRFLNHDYRTDVICFDLSEDTNIEGEIYISVDRARVQAKRYKVSPEQEMLRLMVHGVLHLSGWDDVSRSQKLRMRKREDAIIHAFYAGKPKGLRQENGV